jgi:hypothetical protein
VQSTEFGDLFFARDTKTKEVVPLPEDVKQELLENHPNLRELNIFKVETYGVNPDLDYSSGDDMLNELRMAELALEQGMTKDEFLDAAAAKEEEEEEGKEDTAAVAKEEKDEEKVEEGQEKVEEEEGELEEVDPEIAESEDGAEDRGVSSESYEELLSRPFLDADEEMDEYLKLAGYVPKTPEETDPEDVVHDFDDYTPPQDSRPLTKREEGI